jgi:small subunit ribosomal protein S20
VPNHKSCKKRVKTSELERVRNRSLRTELRSAIKAVRTEQNKDEAKKMLVTASAIIDKAASKGLIHSNNAGRNKSRLARFVQKLG